MRVRGIPLLVTVLISSMIRYVVGQIASDRCLFIFDTCSLNAEDWQNYGINPQQIAYSDQICDANYNKHGAAVIYTALQADPEATVYFFSVLDKYGVGTNEELFAKRALAQQKLLQLRAAGKCTTYAGASFAGRGLINNLDPTSEYLSKLRDSVFDIDLWSSGNDYLRQGHDVCKQVIGPALKYRLNQETGFNYNGPVNIVTGYYEHAGTIIAPEYTNIEGPTAAGACVDLGVTAMQMLPDLKLYGSPVFGGTSASTARANGIISRLSAQLQQAGLPYAAADIRTFLRNLALQATSGQLKDFPLDIFGKNTVPIHNPGLKILSNKPLLFNTKGKTVVKKYLRGSYRLGR